MRIQKSGSAPLFLIIPPPKAPESACLSLLPPEGGYPRASAFVKAAHEYREGNGSRYATDYIRCGVAQTMPYTGNMPFEYEHKGISSMPFLSNASTSECMPWPVAWKKDMKA